MILVCNGAENIQCTLVGALLGSPAYLQQAEEQLRAGEGGAGPYLMRANVSALKGVRENACRYLRQAFEKGGFRQPQEFTGFPENLQDAECFQQLVADIRSQDAEMRRRLRELEKEWEQ